jgi:hypothetical protein
MYTVVIGLIPIILRFFLYFTLSNNYSINIISLSDIAIFGLIIHISIINELEHYSDKNWKIKQTVVSMLFIIIYSFLFALITFSNEVLVIFDKNITILIILMSFVSFLIGYSVHYNSSLKEGLR